MLWVPLRLNRKYNLQKIPHKKFNTNMMLPFTYSAMLNSLGANILYVSSYFGVLKGLN